MTFTGRKILAGSDKKKLTVSNRKAQAIKRKTKGGAGALWTFTLYERCCFEMDNYLLFYISLSDGRSNISHEHNTKRNEKQANNKNILDVLRVQLSKLF